MLDPRPALYLLLAALLGGCAHTPTDDPADPLEPLNRAIYGFNEKADQYLLRPVAVGYTRAVPSEFQRGLHNFFNNLTYPTVIVNDLLQGKFAQAGRDTGRFLFNTTVGLGGFLDPATRIGLTRNEEDLGQTLGYWGVGQGWYLMLPFLGPSTNRDLVGRVGDSFSDPTFYADSEISIPVGVAGAVDTRAQFLGADRLLAQQYDRYIFIRSLYLQSRQNDVYDGNPPKEEFDFGE
jgi:phospholipid-binding lipoprotein MlaA